MALAINERFLLGKSKEWVGCSRYLMIALVENDNWEEIVGRCHAHGGTEFSIGSCIPSKYTNQGKPSGSSFHQKSFPYWPKYFSLTIHSGSYGLGPLVTKIIPDFAGFFNGFFCWKSKHTPWLSVHQPRSSSQGFKRTDQGSKASMFFWLDRDPLLFLSLLLLLFISFFFFLGLWAFMILLNFMNWAFFC